LGDSTSLKCTGTSAKGPSWPLTAPRHDCKVRLAGGRWPAGCIGMLMQRIMHESKMANGAGCSCHARVYVRLPLPCHTRMSSCSGSATTSGNGFCSTCDYEHVRYIRHFVIDSWMPRVGVIAGRSQPLTSLRSMSRRLTWASCAIAFVTLWGWRGTCGLSKGAPSKRESAWPARRRCAGRWRSDTHGRRCFVGCWTIRIVVLMCAFAGFCSREQSRSTAEIATSSFSGTCHCHRNDLAPVKHL
jgi:hypothetical protein